MGQEELNNLKKLCEQLASVNRTEIPEITKLLSEGRTDLKKYKLQGTVFYNEVDKKTNSMVNILTGIDKSIKKLNDSLKVFIDVQVRNNNMKISSQ